MIIIIALHFASFKQLLPREKVLNQDASLLGRRELLVALGMVGALRFSSSGERPRFLLLGYLQLHFDLFMLSQLGFVRQALMG